MDDGDEEFPSDYLEGDICGAGADGKAACISCTIISKDSASYLHEKPS